MEIPEEIIKAEQTLSSWMKMNNIQEFGGIADRNLFNGKIEELEKKLKESEERVKLLCSDWAEDDTAIKELCEPFVGKEFIDDNSGYFITMVEVVEETIKRLTKKA
jgi:hypothetical protein